MKGETASGGLRPAAVVEGGGLDALIEYGRQLGNAVTYDEINAFMPENIVTAAQIDVWVDRLSAEGIDIVEQR